MDRRCKVICNLDGDVGRKFSNTSAYLMQIQGVENTVWELGEIENEEADRESMACN